jgi:hypothetical protein
VTGEIDNLSFGIEMTAATQQTEMYGSTASGLQHAKGLHIQEVNAGGGDGVAAWWAGRRVVRRQPGRWC